MKRLKFYKESDNRWYVDLPEWEGSKAELEMVAGADSMLEYMAEGEAQVWIMLSEDEFENADRLEFLRLATEIEKLTVSGYVLFFAVSFRTVCL
jgi:hypothetical protein